MINGISYLIIKSLSNFARINKMKILGKILNCHTTCGAHTFILSSTGNRYHETIVKNRMHCSFKGKKVLVTGAGRGIGKELVKALHQDGAVVYALSKNPVNLTTLEKECPGTLQCDLTDWKGTEEALENLEPLDHLVNNAGVTKRESLLESTEETFNLLFNTNVKPIINVTKIISKKMIEGGKQGSIVNVSSIVSKNAVTGLMTYSASKAAVDMLTKSMAMELAPHGIRVMSINPAIVLTDMALETMSDVQLETVRKQYPLQAFPTTKACIDGIMFLLSDLAQYSTGTCLYVDSGKLTNTV